MSAPWFSVATRFLNDHLKEAQGPANNATIVEMFRVSGHPEVKDDETPWCAAFVGACLRLSGYKSSGSLGARSYQTFGEDLRNQPRKGCIVVFWRDDPKSAKGHVALYDREDGDGIFVLGGNQGDAVSFGRFPKSRVVAYRWPTETAPLPTDTNLPNILSIDPANAPPHLAPGAAVAPAREAEIPRGGAAVVMALSEGSEGPEVRALQTALSARNFSVGEIDGEFGPNTRNAVAAFQRTRGLPMTGVADQRTLQALAAAPTVPSPLSIPTERPSAMRPEDILRLLFSALLTRGATAAGGMPSAPSPGAVNTQQILQLVLGALTAQHPAGGQPVLPSPTSPTGTVPPVLSPIDRILGGEALAGKKTPLAVLAYTVLAVLQSVDVAGTATGATATPTGQILTTLIGAFGGLGVLGKVDRVVQMLGVIAAKPTAPPPPPSTA